MSAASSFDFGSPEFNQGSLQAVTRPQSFRDRGIEVFHVFSNPAIRDSDRYRRFVSSIIAEAKEQDFEYVGHDSSPTYEGFVESLESINDEYDDTSTHAHATYSGDGTRGNCQTAHHKTGGLAVFFAGGHKDDTAAQANTKESLEHPELLLRSNLKREIYPLEIEIKTGETTVTSLAWSYASIGISAFTAERVNSPKYRASRFQNNKFSRSIQEYLTAANAIARAPGYTITHDGISKPGVELVVANGSIMAGIFKTGADLFEREARIVEAGSIHKLLGSIVAMQCGFTVGRSLDKPLEFQVHGPKGFWVQRDGEDMHFDGEANIRVSLSDRSVPVLVAA